MSQVLVQGGFQATADELFNIVASVTCTAMDNFYTPSVNFIQLHVALEPDTVGTQHWVWLNAISNDIR